MTASSWLAVMASKFAASRGGRRVLLTDYDGTLVHLAPEPSLAVADAELHALLRTLVTRDVEIHVISGRSRELLEAWLGVLPVHLHSQHGAWSRAPSGEWIERFVDDTDAWMPTAIDFLAALAATAPGAFLEVKSSSITVHHLDVARALHGVLRGNIKHVLTRLCAEHDLEIVEGRNVVHVRPQKLHKGVVTRAVMDALPTASFVVAIGDDVTDEDIFAAVPDDAITICAGPGQTRAKTRVRGPDEVRAVLEELASTV